MNFYKRAIKYLTRKRGKTILLFLLLLVLNTMVLSAITILRASEEGKDSIQKKTQTKLFVEIKEENTVFQDEEVRMISMDDNVESVNCICKAVGYLKSGTPITGSDNTDESNNQIKLYGYDDYKKDGPVVDSQIRLFKGKIPEKDNQALVHRDLAKINSWDIGDKIGIIGTNGKESELEITGLFFSGMEDGQSNDLQSVYRIENQIYMMPQQILQLQKNKGYEKIIVYLNDPENLKSSAEMVKEILKNKAEIAEADALYKQLKYPLEQISRVMKLMLCLTIGTAVIVVTILMCMWVRARKKEIAVYISLGETKCEILCQIVLETILVFGCSFIISSVVGIGLSDYMEKMLVSYVGNGVTLHVAIQKVDLVLLGIIGMIILMIGIGISLIPVISANPKDTLSEMEG